MKVLFIGLGSIGQRHLRNLLNIGEFEFYAYRIRKNPLPEEFNNVSISIIESLDNIRIIKPDFCIISSPPAFQEKVLPFIINSGCNFFIEKPIATKMEGLEELLNKVDLQQLTTMIGYNLRYHPVHKKLDELIKSRVLGNIISVNSIVGQYLPDWHPNEDYRKGYSANKSLGGGVTLDLIHEIDFVYSLFGKVNEVKAFIGKNSSLEINTEDTSEILLKFESGVLGHVHLDYVQRKPTRNGLIIGDKGTAHYNLLTSEVILTDANGEKEKYFFEFQRNDMYVNEMNDFILAIKNKSEVANNFRAGIEVLKIALLAKQDAF